MIAELVSLMLMQAPASEDLKPTYQIDPYALCSCVKKIEGDKVEFTGIASDAQMLLGEDGRSAVARQATIFRVLKSPSADIGETAKVWHVTAPEKCGVKFDYGKRYDVIAVKKPDGELETSYCVMSPPMRH